MKTYEEFVNEVRARKRSVECSVCGSHYFLASHDKNNPDAPVWVCSNCGNVTKRVVRKSKKQKEIDDLYDSL